MKKRYLIVLTLLLMIPFVVSAETKPKVLTLEAEANGSTISYEGTVESGSHAVMCKLYNSSDELLGNLSVSVNNLEFEGTFTTTNNGEYTVACANYEGGEIKSVEVTVEDNQNDPTNPPEPPTPTIFHVSFNTGCSQTIDTIDVEEGQTVSEPNVNLVNGDKMFGGWYEDDTFNKAFDFNTPITGNIELFALWTDPVTYKVDFDTRCEQGIDSVYVNAGQTISEPNVNLVNGDKIFGGWYEDDTFNKAFDFNTPITSNMVLYALWNDPVIPTVPYDVPDGNGNFVSFNDEDGHTYTLTITDFLAMSKEEVISLAGITEEEYDQTITLVTNAVKKHGNLISLYEIVLSDENGTEITDKSVNIRIRLTEAMKKYNTLKLIYLKDDMTIESPITLKINGNFAEGKLNHLSTYVLVGTNTTTQNPKTNDNIYIWYGVIAISAVGLLVVSRKMYKSKVK